MDTRQLPAAMEPAPDPRIVASETELEVVELTALPPPRRVRGAWLALALVIALLGAAVAIAGMPGRSEFALSNPLPNMLAPNSAP